MRRGRAAKYEIYDDKLAEMVMYVLVKCKFEGYVTTKELVKLYGHSKEYIREHVIEPLVKAGVLKKVD